MIVKRGTYGNGLKVSETISPEIIGIGVLEAVLVDIAR
jgi:hypothetical protein